MSVTDTLQGLIDAEARKPNTHGVILRVQSGDGRIDWAGAAGAATPDTRFAIASITKMFTAAMILQLAEAGRLDLDQTVQSLLGGVDLTGLHVVKGVDHSPRLTVRHLLHQTSGLADYYESDLAHDLKAGKDRPYGLDEVLQMTRALPPQAAPDSGKSHYSDTNYQLLGAVIEAVTGRSYAEAVQVQLCRPLGLTQTQVLDGPDLGLPIYHKDRRLEISQILTSMGPDGGLISTLDDLLVFLRALLQGPLLEPGTLAQMRQWNRLFLPIQYGYGLMRIKLPRWMTLFRATPELIGHSGASGTFAYYAPQQDLYLLGSFNQTDAPQRPIGFMLRALGKIAAERGTR